MAQVDGVAPPLPLCAMPSPHAQLRRHACRPWQWLLAFQSLRNVGLAILLGRVIRRRVIRIYIGRAVALFYFVFITLYRSSSSLSSSSPFSNDREVSDRDEGGEQFGIDLRP